MKFKINRIINIKNSLGKIILLSFVVLTTTYCTTPEKFQNIQTGFVTPHDTNNVWCYWYWINDDISKEGITKDLEAMKEVGIGAVFIGNINQTEADRPVLI